MPRGTDPSEPQCLSEAFLARLIDGRLSPEELSHVHEHTAECPACRQLVVALVRGGLRFDSKGAELGVDPAQGTQTETPPAPSAAGWTPPDEFDEFRLERPLGRGAMGVVYLAHDRSLDRQVAVKFIAAHQPGDQARQRFQIEARAIARLQHPNVVTVFRVGEVGDHPYIVSEYLVGQSLAELPSRLPWRRVLSLGIGVARGLAAAHRHGVLHGDLKPANILLTTAGEVKLLDFGLARLVEAREPTGSDGARAAAGTPRYMAPELFRGEPASPQSDLYALSLILFELCTGTVPPQRRGPHGSPPLTQSVPGIDPDFASLIERCLRGDPAERMGSAEMLCAELERLGRPQEPGILSVENPYRGLAPFEAEHRALFFGRDADIRAVIERLRRQPLVLVAGDSGVGKSSLCRAGILPHVAQGGLDEYRDFHALTLEPGRRPLAALAAALAPVLGQTEPEVGQWLAEAPERLGAALRAAHQEGQGLLLFVDQLEELVTVNEPAQAARFAILISELALPAAGVRVLLAVRGDFLARMGTLPGLGTEVERALYLLRPLTPEGIRDAIVGPARGRGVVFESEALLGTLVDATAQSAGSLPLLQFTLAELWERRDRTRGCITRQALEEMGGVAGALSRHADAVLARLTPTQQQTARRLFGRLITPEGTRGERSEDELTAGSEETLAALRALVEGRLLHARTRGGRTSYEIAHEALIERWGALRQWMDEDIGQRALRQRIESAGAEWARLGRTDDLLWRGRQLDEIRMLDEAILETRERDFLSSSRRAVRRQRQRRWLSALALVMTAIGFYGGLRFRERVETQAYVTTQMADAEKAFAEGGELAQSASARRESAIHLFNQNPLICMNKKPEYGVIQERVNEEMEQAEKELYQADMKFDKAEQILSEVLWRVHEQLDARQLLAELTYERILLAEYFHRNDKLDRLVQFFKRVTAEDPVWQERLDAKAMLELETGLSEVRVELERYEEGDKGALRREPVTSFLLKPADVTPKPLLPGSYLLRFSRAGDTPVNLPLFLKRGGHKRVAVDHVFPKAKVPKGYVYIPRGCVLTGSAEPERLRRKQESVPIHETCFEEGYLIGRTEVTLGEWIQYLNTPAGKEQRHLLNQSSCSGERALTLQQQADGSWSFSMQFAEGLAITAHASELFRYPVRAQRVEQDWLRFPLAGISVKDFEGYLSWLDSSGQVPGARLCTDREWIRGARGADGRRYPHGSELRRDDVNIDVTYGFKAESYGPDGVGMHANSESPFGLLDMTGNVLEVTRAEAQGFSDYVLHGGAWYYSAFDAEISTLQATEPELRDPRIGFRVCAPIQD